MKEELKAIKFAIDGLSDEMLEHRNMPTWRISSR